jgi:hypothetical protein
MQSALSRISESSTYRLLTREPLRIYLVRIVVVIYLLLLLSGPLRKWVFPQFQTILFFIRVPFVFLLYIVAFKGRAWPKTNLPLLFGYILSAIAIFVVLIQVFLGGYDAKYLILAGYGWLSYFFYIPMVFIVAENFKRDDLYKILKLTLYITILETPLVLLQFNSSPSSIFNSGSAIDAENQFLSLSAALGRVRPTGFFSSSAGQTLFLSVSAIAVIYGWINQSSRVFNRYLLLVATFGLFAMVAYSGSRSTLILISVIVILTLIGSFITGRARLAWRTVSLTILLILCLALLWPIFFPDGYQVFITRWIGAYESEASAFNFSTFGRIFY